MRLGARKDPYGATNFVITLIDSSAELMSTLQQIDRTASGGFSECSGLESTIECEEYKEGGNNGPALIFPTRAKTTPLVLKRGITTNDDLWIWHNSFIMGRGKRKSGLIVLQNESRQAVKAWAFQRGIPTKYVGATLNAMESGVALEELAITHEGLALLANGATSLSNIIGAVSSSIDAIGSLFE